MNSVLEIQLMKLVCFETYNSFKTPVQNEDLGTDSF